MIHSINSIRVIAEFFVVKYHLFHRVDSAAFRPVALNSLACEFSANASLKICVINGQHTV